VSVPLAALTTLRVGGPARSLVTARTEAELVEAVATADAAGAPVLVLGGGSNLLVADAGFDGTVVHVQTRGVRVLQGDWCGGILVTVAAGEPWDAFVERAVAERWVGVEALSGIPGSTGATPLQNVGAYGQEVAQTSPGCAPGTDSKASCVPSPAPTACSVTAPAGSRARTASSCST
jgi:UDP-N-acetylmuramate dehydrogenase